MEQLTLEQALQNIKMVLNEFVGKKADHIVLEQSIKVIEENLIKPEATKIIEESIK